MSGVSAQAIGVFGESNLDPAIYGQSRSDRGVFGYGLRYGLHGISGGHGSDADPTVYAGVYGQGGDFGSYSEGLIGLYSRSTVAAGMAGWFDGSILVNGGLVVLGYKAAGVPHPDGTVRELYSLEAPESWFEDFGRAEVTDGQARVELDPDFASLVRTDDYHVFLTPEGETKGLYVSNRSSRAFEVREQEQGTNTLVFSYRVVARRGDVEPRRLSTVETPPERTPTHFEPRDTWTVWDEPS